MAVYLGPMNPIRHAINLAGGPVALTRELNKRIGKPVTYQAVLKWARQGRLPRTEWTGETRYAKAISAAIGGQIKVRELLVRPDVPVNSKPNNPAATANQAQVAIKSEALQVAQGVD